MRCQCLRRRTTAKRAALGRLAPQPSQHVWGNVLRDLARRTNLSPLDAARGYALLGMTMHDGLLASFNGKFLYGLWRPVTAIREAERDGNPDTAADPTWLSLIPTPPYPTYPGNMTCLASGAHGPRAPVRPRFDRVIVT